MPTYMPTMSGSAVAVCCAACLWVATAVVGTVGIGSLRPVAGTAPRTRLEPPRQVAQAPTRQSPAPATTSAEAAFLTRYCLTCHNERLKTAGLTLEGLNPERPGERPEIWETVVRKLRAGAMPPASARRPDAATAEAFIAKMEGELDRAAAANPNPGRPSIHRLNRTEYANAVRDLFAVEIDARALLPADTITHGFDNVADGLAVSHSLLERYLSAARKISRLAVGAPVPRPVTETYRISPALWQHERMNDDLPHGTRGGAAISHYFPVDGEYSIRIRMERTYAGGPIRGLGEPNELEVRVDGQRVKLFTIGATMPGGRRSAAGGRGAVYEGDQERGAVPPQRREDADAGLEVRVPVKAGPRVIGVAFLKRTAALEGIRPDQYPVLSNSNAADNTAPMRVEHVAIGGPFNATGPGDTPSRRRIFVCQPVGTSHEDACAKTILTTLARRAYRRSVSESDVAPLLDLYREGRSEGGFEAGIQWALEKVLTSADFLFRIERDPSSDNGGVHRISDLELASRLSFFLWSSPPDDQLLEIAERGRLKDPAVLEKQVTRMLADSRASALIDNFFGQWLYLRNIWSVAPDPKTFPEFDENLRAAFNRETSLFLESQLRADRPLMETFTADYSFLNERLARHYGIPSIYGSHFRRVQFSDERRGGLLGHGSVLTVTSYAHRTSPVLRGKWMLENLIGMPPPPPPPDIPALKENDEGETPTSVRERLEQHRKNPVCSSCHAQMDPPGFALENFDAVGKWRSVDGVSAVDASGMLPDGTKFSGPAEFRRVLSGRRDLIATTVVRKLLTYALGRGAESYDEPSIRAVVREAQSEDYRWTTLLFGIVKSTPFQMRKGIEP